MYIIKKDNIRTYCEYSSSNSGLSVVEVGEEILARGMEIPAHRDNFIVHFVTKGKGIFNCDNKEYFLKEGDAFVITPSNLVSYYTSSDDGWSYCWINLTGLDCNGIFEKCGLIDNVVFKYDKENIAELLSLIEELDDIDLNTINQDAFSLRVLGVCINLLHTLCLKLNPNQEVGHIEKNESILDRAIDYINFNFRNNITISKLCKDINVSRVYFTTLFTRSMRQSPGHYLTARRIHNACEILLAYKDLKISKVAVMSGFQSTAQFCKCFKKNTGMSPTEYKKVNAPN